jgi:hypothetical protein
MIIRLAIGFLVVIVMFLDVFLLKHKTIVAFDSAGPVLRGDSVRRGGVR